MEVVVAIIILLVNILVYIKTKKSINYLSLFSFFWILMVMFSKLGLFGLHTASIRAYDIVNIGGAVYALVYLFAISIHHNRAYIVSLSKNEATSVAYGDNVKIKIYFALFVFVAIIQTVFLARALSIYLSGGSLKLIHSAIRDLSGSGIIRTKLEKLLNTLVIQPFIFAAIPISIIALFTKTKHYVIIVLSSMFLSLTYFFTHAGRIIIIDYIVYLLFTLQAQNIKVNKKTKWRVMYFILISLVIIMLITASRRGFDFSIDFIQESFIKEFYDYFAIPIPQLSFWIERAESVDLYSNGLAFFNGFIELPIQLLESVGVDISKYLNTVEMINQVEMIYTNAAYSTMRYNAFVTLFYFFYIDFRFVGVILGSATFGFVSGIIDNSFRKGSFRNVALYLMFSQCIARVFARWQFYRTNYVLAFVFIILLCNNHKKTGD